jgi:lysophospholipase L1-like esterase
MKTFVFTILFALIALLMPADKKKRIIFFGDSITESGVKPGGYLVRMDSMIALQGKADLYELVGSGISGNKIYDLYLRLDEDVLNKKPDVVVLYIGVNDVWHKRSAGTGTDPDKFEKFYNAILSKLAANNIKAVLCTPAVIGEKTDYTNEQDGDLNKYSNIIRGIADKNHLPLIDLRKIFLEYDLKNNPSNKESGILTTDRVHLNARGNQLVAEEMLKVILAF